jgi:2-phosphoglycolate phosphatase
VPREAGSASTLGSGPRVLPVRAVLFDLDGTLADTAPDLAAALNRLRRTRGLDPLPLEQLRNHASHGARGLLGAGLAMDKTHAEFESARDAFLDHYAEALCIDTVLFPGVDEVLAEITSRGLKWGIDTNKASRFTLPLLQQLTLDTRAGAVVSGDTTPQAKPHPGPLLAAAAMLDVAPGDCVYVGDAERDVLAGRAAGMLTLVARYGYIHTDETPDAWLADGSLDSIGDVLQWLPRAASQRPITAHPAD